jgi:sigma-54 dependent transcriptional regulator, acetoin dehydrogenase operon transcriptional activator AcoR
LRLPPLRERREDIGVLVAEILRRHAPQPEAVVLTRRAVQALLGYSWPGNIRELEQALQVALALADGGEIQLAHLPEPLRSGEPPAPGPESWPQIEAAGEVPADSVDLLPRERRRAAQLIQLLTEHGGNVAAVSRALGKQRTLVHRWLRRLGIDPEQYRR